MSPAASPADPRRRPIGVFDSGVGGLTVLHELLVALPHEDFLYLGDSARLPYGERSADELQRFSIEIAGALEARGAKALVVACNAAASAALGPLRERFERPGGLDVISVVEPEALAAAVATRSGRVGLLATQATVASGAYARAVAAADPHVRLTSIACPALVPLIQRGFPFGDELVDAVRAYCAPLREARVDTVILGCTHYPLIRPMLQRMLGPDVTLITSGSAIARRLECALQARDLGSPSGGEGDYRFLTTGDPEEFRVLGSHFLQLPLQDVSLIDLSAPSAVERV